MSDSQSNVSAVGGDTDDTATGSVTWATLPALTAGMACRAGFVRNSAASASEPW